MSTRSLEDAFARFRDERDLAALAEVFDRTAPELLEVARHLARGRSEAEDLVQATFLAALEGAGRFEEGRELVPWLIGILVNLARRARGQRGAVGEPSEEIADARAADPAERAAEGEFRLALEVALARLPRRYRDVLASRLSDGEAPEEIARRLGRAPGTVRVQMHRGFEHLRRLLPAGFALGALGLLSSRGLASVRAEVLRVASGRRVPLAETLTIGGELVGKKVALVTLVLVVAGSGLWLSGRAQRAEPAQSVAAATGRGDLEAPAPLEVAAAGSATERVALAAASTGTESAASEPYGGLALELTWWDGTPADGVTARIEPWGEHQPNLHFQILLTDEKGHARTDRIHEGWVVIEILRLGLNGRYQTEVRRGLTTTERIAIPRGYDVEGRVVDADGAPAGGARLWMKESFTEPAQDVGRAASDGSFLARSLPEGCEILATADGRGSSASVEWNELETVDASTRRTELRLRGENAELAGRITDAGGKPVAGALVSILCTNDRQGSNLSRWRALQVTGDADGNFRIGGLHGGRAQVQVAAPDFAAWQKVVELEEDRTTSLDVVVDRGFSVEGTFTGLAGSSMTEARVLLSEEPLAIRDLWTAPDSEGRYLLERIPAGKALVVATVGVDDQSPRSQKRIEGRAGETLRWDVEFGTGAAVRGRARDESGRALAGWRVRAIPKMGTGGWTSVEIVTDEQGAFLIPDLVADATYDVLVYAPEDENHSQPRARVEGVLAGGASIELVVHGERAPSAFLSGRVLDPDGNPVRPSQLWAYSEDELDSIGDPQWSQGERFRMGPMLAGAYQLSLTVAGFPGTTLDLELAEGEERDLGDIELSRPGRVELTLRDRDGQPIAEAMSVFLQEAGRFVHRLTSADGLVYGSEALFPGAYQLRIMSGAFAPERPVSIEVRAGETTTMEVSLSPARTVTLEFRVPEGEPLPRRTRCELREADGALLADFEVGRMVSPGKPDRLGENCALPLGRIRYSVRSSDGWSASGEFEVQNGEGWSQRETVTLER